MCLIIKQQLIIAVFILQAIDHPVDASSRVKAPSQPYRAGMLVRLVAPGMIGQINRKILW